MTPEERKEEFLERLRVALAVLPPEPDKPANQVMSQASIIYDHAKRLPPDVIPARAKMTFLVQDVLDHFRPPRGIGVRRTWFVQWLETQREAHERAVEDENEQDQD